MPITNLKLVFKSKIYKLQELERYPSLTADWHSI